MTNRIRMRRRHKRHKQRTRVRNEARRYYWEHEAMASAWTRLAEMVEALKSGIFGELKIPEDMLESLREVAYSSAPAATEEQKLCLDALSSS